ncbi:hypothetical protein AJ79_02558 [Helicocarpus griseus UAMH5409]|uniref:Fungal-type protein kinase domain-containing protein n=1 Tax=Helicocarpus griseus UAMH5409 TaxID=1447875 RepID=A0A2B7Y2C2_9EURO|nr:hypothetical protein AJ79_02558 [Helicocarpus griseus UAMH5409]
MSLIDHPLLFELWKEAQEKASDEWASAGFWVHLWSKHIFWEKEWAIAQEGPPEGTGRRRVDVKIRRLAGDNNFTVLAFHESKLLDASPKEVQEAETQAKDACKLFIEQSKDQSFVYAITSFGTKARAWVYEKEGDGFKSFFGSDVEADRKEYIEAHSTDASYLRRAFIKMKNDPPIL